VAKSYGNGLDKLAFPRCQAYALENLPRIRASARSPLEPGDGQWWMQGEAPWQLLAACCEIDAALESGDPPSFRSRLPLQQVRQRGPVLECSWSQAHEVVARTA
jgi:DNA-directed RNA polymerase